VESIVIQIRCSCSMFLYQMMFVMIFFLHFFTIELVITCLSFFHRMFLIFFLVSFYFLIKVLLFYRSKLKQVFFIRLHHLRFVIALYSLLNFILKDPNKSFLIFLHSIIKFYFFSLIHQLLTID
jgi:hypothetical protein